jgi:CheY-like chemotaxis protein
MIRDERPVLVLGQHDPALGDLTERIRALGYRARRIKTAEEALDLAQDRDVEARAIVMEAALPAYDLGRAVSVLRARLADGRPDSIIATAEYPEGETLDRLRDAHVTLALWGGAGDHTLRFQINRASAEQHLLSLRQDTRVPTEWRTVLSVGGRRKPTSVYSLSGGGAYLATPRPSQRGAELAVSLPLPDGVVDVAGRVLYTNVPGNLHDTTLPNGMGIEFRALPTEARRSIEDAIRSVEDRHLV